MSNPASVSGDRRGRAAAASASRRSITRAIPDDQAAQRRAVVVALEAALAHLAERHEREHLLRGARPHPVERDVGEQLDIDDVAGEQLDRGGIARDERERDAARGEFDQSGGDRRRSSAAFRMGRAVAMKRKDRPGAVCGLGTRTHRLGGGPPGGVREHAVTISDERMPDDARLRIGSEFCGRRPACGRGS